MRRILTLLFVSAVMLSCTEKTAKPEPAEPQSAPQSKPEEGCLCGSEEGNADSQPNTDSQPTDSQTPNLYTRVGGDEAVHKIAMGFYARIEKDPKYKLLLDLHGGDLGETPEHLYEFLSQWLGGPTLYNDRHGPPMLRMRHEHIPIDTNAADLWLACMKETLEENVQDATLRGELMTKFQGMAYHLRNQETK